MATRSNRKDEPVVRCDTEVSLDTKLLELAKELDIDVSQACENGLAKGVAAEHDRRWQEENRGAIDAYNAWIEENRIPLAEHRMF